MSLTQILNNGCDLIATKPNKSVISYTPLSILEAEAHVSAGGSLAWRHPSLTAIDIDNPNHQELMCELVYQGIEFQYTKSATTGHGHAYIAIDNDDYDWKGLLGYGEVRHKRYTQLYETDALLKAVDCRPIDISLIEILPPALPKAETQYEGSEVRILAFNSYLLNGQYEWESHAKGTGMPMEVAEAQWNTGQLSAERKLKKARKAAQEVAGHFPRSKNLVEGFAIMRTFANSDECWLSQTQMGKALGISQQAAGALYKRMKKLGLIEFMYWMPNRGQGKQVARWRLRGGAFSYYTTERQTKPKPKKHKQNTTPGGAFSYYATEATERDYELVPTGIPGDGPGGWHWTKKPILANERKSDRT